MLAAFAALIVVVGVGCGGGDDDGGTSATANSQTNGQTATQETGEESAESGESEGEGGGSNGGAAKDEGSDGAGGPLIAEANVICEESSEEYRAEVTKFFSREVKSREEEEEIYEEIVTGITVPTIEDRIEDLQALSGSENEEEAIDEVSVKLEAMADEAEAEVVAFSEGAIPAGIDARETAKDLGLKRCGLFR